MVIRIIVSELSAHRINVKVDLPHFANFLRTRLIIAADVPSLFESLFMMFSMSFSLPSVGISNASV